MKILHCIPGMGGGGAERQLAYLVGPLSARGWDVHVALGTGGPNLRRLQAGGATVHWITVTRNHDPRRAWQLARIFRRVQPDIAQVWLLQMEILGGGVSEMLGTPWVMSERSSLLAYPPSMKNRARVMMGRTANAIISNSIAGDSYWASRVSPRVRRCVIPNAVPLDEIDAACAGIPAGLPIRSDDTLVLFAGRFSAEKNVERLFIALRRIVERPRTVAVLCGEGPLRSGLQRRIADENLGDRIFAPGYVADIWPLMKRADVMVALSFFEGCPNSVLEAMACERPLVVSDIPAHREILDERAAWWVEPADPQGLAVAVLDILADPDEARRRAAVARSRARELSVGAISAQYDRVYRELLHDDGAVLGEDPELS